MLLAPLLCLASLLQPVSVTPVPQDADWWRQRHEQKMEVTRKGGYDVAFLGDSITQGWEGGGKATWDEFFAPMKSANFGYSGDRTEHVLWRLQKGEMLPAKPKVVVVMIGTNNVGHGSSNPAQTVEGIRAILAAIRKGSPKTQVLLLAVFPRGATADDRLRVQVGEINAGLRRISYPGVRFLDIGHHFVRSDGTLKDSLMPDLLHLNADGYGIWARAIASEVRGMLRT
jgi:lysophospholipase L1-like esterase